MLSARCQALQFLYLSTIYRCRVWWHAPVIQLPWRPNFGTVWVQYRLGLRSFDGWVDFVTTCNPALGEEPNENTRDKQQRYFNKRLCGVKVTTENAYGILKGKWRILYKKTECHLFNLCYVLMTCIALHNLCNELADPCQPRSKLKVQELALIRKQLHREEDMNESALNRMKISSWLWMDH